jgi:hypothetical protein
MGERLAGHKGEVNRGCFCFVFQHVNGSYVNNTEIGRAENTVFAKGGFS